MKDNKMNSLLPIYSKIAENFIPENGDNFRYLESILGQEIANRARKNISEACPIVRAKLNSKKNAINVFYFYKDRKDRSHSCVRL